MDYNDEMDEEMEALFWAAVKRCARLTSFSYTNNHGFAWSQLVLKEENIRA